MTFQLKVKDQEEVTVTCCGDCPANIEKPPALSFLPFPSHHCKHTFSTMFKEGEVIMNPNIIPAWCPHVSP